MIKWDPWQIKFLETKGDKILLSGRQVGKTEVAAADAAEWAYQNQNARGAVVMIAPYEKQAYALFRKTLNYLKEKYPHIISRKDKPTKEKITLKDGLEIYCLPVGISGLGMRFLTIARLYVDEGSRVPEDVHDAVDPALLTTGADTIYLSSANGAKGRFYDCWVNKDGAFDSFTRFSVTSEVVIKEREICETWTEKQRDKALAFLDRCKRRMSKSMYAQEYLGAFIESFNRYFSDELISKCCVLKRPNEIQKTKTYFLGVDIARLGDDQGTYEILVRHQDGTLEQVESIITEQFLTTQTEDKILELERLYKFKKIYIDAGSGGLGVGVYDHLKNEPTTRNKVEKVNNREVVYSDDSVIKLLKEDLYDNLKRLMEQGQIKLLDDDDVIESLASIQFEYVITPSKATRMEITGNYSHVVEGLIRAAVCSKDKHLNLWCHYN